MGKWQTTTDSDNLNLSILLLNSDKGALVGTDFLMRYGVNTGDKMHPISGIHIPVICQNDATIVCRVSA